MYLDKSLLISGDAGHNCYPDSGAVGIRVEDTCTKEIWLSVQAKLISLGYKVKDTTPYNQRFNSVSGSLGYRVNLANASGSQFHLCVHLNIGGGKGVEAWISATGGRAEELANQLCNSIAGLGYTNRGVKVGNLYVPKYTNMPCVLIEVCFLDSQEDMNRYNVDSISNAIVKALTNETASSGGNNQGGNSGNTVDQKTDSNTTITSNAVIVNDWLYVRDSSGNIIPGRVDVGDKIQVKDVQYGNGLALVKYPVPSGTRTEFVKNATNCISYFYQNQWSNGSTSEIVYEDSACTKPIGKINPYEKATPLCRVNGVLKVVYNTIKGTNTKSGFVRYNGGFNKF
ncbi:N-acetylmuramoyl-L-alanine amidase [Inconstantimicrobium mannanitabidum]|uniref:Uncharacterized protein n=1 Tax=Inconstantimicrobium mannanitabidum TaxID=1604901 RepID=A0ACB5RAJ9_9CLOT|nr:N-acetylmuramoyl-L-alanine amidase [Clostridium sp. TW13]GKX66217.1 hypothetical protein rsdtw13_14750 [Clostridium sp. TW13]